MLKLKLAWELETGERFEDWTIPIELSLAEKEFYQGKSIVSVLQQEGLPSATLQLFLAHKIQQRVTKKVENFEKNDFDFVFLLKPTDIPASVIDGRLIIF